jgi:hypothetical protein
MAAKPGMPGTHPVTMPIRQGSHSSAMSDDAIPTSDPKDVGATQEPIDCIKSDQTLILFADVRTFRGAFTSMEACSGIPRGLCQRNREGGKGTCEGI